MEVRVSWATSQVVPDPCAYLEGKRAEILHLVGYPTNWQVFNCTLVGTSTNGFGQTVINASVRFADSLTAVFNGSPGATGPTGPSGPVGPPGPVPLGTGLFKVIGGLMVAAASLLVNADVDPAAAIAVAKLAPGSNTQVLTTTGGISGWASPVPSGISQLTGDGTAGPGAGSQVLTITRVNGATVPAAGGLVAGNVLQASGGTSLTYGPVNLAGGANYVTGVLPTANQAPQAMGGDVTGTAAAAVVVKVNGATVPAAGALVTGNAAYVSGVSALTYSALNLAGGANYVTGVLPIINQAAQAMGGDVTGTTTANSIVRVLSNVTLEGYGAVGDGVTDDHAAYTAALAAARTVFIGAKTYLTPAYSGGLAANTSIFGTGSQSVIKNLSNQPIVTISGDWTRVSGIHLFGTFGAGATNHGINGGPYSHVMVDNVWVYEPGHHGIVFTGNTAANQGPTISNVRVFDAVNGAGIALDGSQYATVSNAHVIGSTYGIYIDAGNAVVTGSTFDLNTYGLYVNNVNGNDGHAVIVGCNFNHSTVEAIHIEPLVNGLDIRSSNIYYGDIRVIGGVALGQPSLVRFISSAIDVANLQLDGALVEFDGCVWPSANSNTFNKAVNAHPSTIIWRPNNMKTDGTPFDSTVDPQWDVAGTRNLNIKWAGTTVRSHWSGAHGLFYAGQGTTESATVIGPVPGFETSTTGVFGVGTSFDCGVAPTSTNPFIYTDGGSTIVNSPHHLGFGSISFYAAGSGFLGKFDALNSVFSVGSKFKFDWNAAALQTIDSTATSFTLSQATHATTPHTMTVQAQNVTTGTGSDLALTSGTGSVAAGNTLLQAGSSTIATVSTASVALTSGKFLSFNPSPSLTVGHIRVPNSTVIIGARSSDGVSDTEVLKTLATTLTLGQVTYGSTTVTALASIRLTSGTNAYDSPNADITLQAQSPFAGATGTHRGAGSTIVNIPAGIAGNTHNGGLVVQYAGTPISLFGELNGTGVAAGAIWLGPVSAAPTATNFSMYAATGNLVLQDAAAIVFNIGATVVGQFSSTTVTLPPLGGSGIGLVGVSNTGLLSFESFSALAGSTTLVGDVTGAASSNIVEKATGVAGVFAMAATAAAITWAALTTSPTVTQSTALSDVATKNITLQAQSPYASATLTNRDAGDIIVNTPASVGGSVTKNGGLQVQYAGTTLVRAGVYHSSASNYGMVWFLDGGTPTITNFTVAGDLAGNSYLNATTDFIFSISGSSYYASLKSTRFAIGAGTYNTYMYQWDTSATAVQHFTANATTAKIVYDTSTTGAGAAFTIQGQTALAASAGVGGDVVVTSGLGDGVGANGSFIAKAGAVEGFRVTSVGASSKNNVVGILGGNNLGTSYCVTGGGYPGLETSTGGLWILPQGTARTTANVAIAADSTSVSFGAPTAIYLGVFGVNYMRMRSSELQLGSAWNTPQYTFDFSTTAVMHFAVSATVSASIVYDGSSSAVAGKTFTIQGQPGGTSGVQAGGALNFISGAGFGGGVAGNIVLAATGSIASPSITISPTDVQLSFAPLTFTTTTIAPVISQTLHATTPHTFTVQAQNVTTGTGSDLALTSGTGSVANGNVLLKSGASTVATASASGLLLNAGLNLHTTAVSTTPYTIDGSGFQLTILVDCSGGARTLTLPVPVDGRTILITDSTFSAATNNVTIAPHGADKIGGVAANKVMSAAGFSVMLVSNGTDWFVWSC